MALARVAAPSRQTVVHQELGALTVELVATDTGPWWVWKDRRGVKVHAGMAQIQLVRGVWFRHSEGRWREISEP